MIQIPLGKDSFVSSIVLPFVRRFGKESLEMDPLMARDAFETAFNIKKMPQKMFDKLNCGLTLIGTSLFTTSIEGFLTGCACMNNMVLNSDTIPFVSLEQCAWGVWEYMNLNGDMDENKMPTETFSPDIIKYIQEAGKLNGIMKYPAWLDFAKLPDDAFPDLSDDVALFNAFMSRQDDYVTSISGFVALKQEQMAAELKKLADAGYIA